MAVIFKLHYLLQYKSNGQNNNDKEKLTAKLKKKVYL